MGRLWWTWIINYKDSLMLSDISPKFKEKFALKITKNSSIRNGK
jgi:hypothetical protein